MQNYIYQCFQKTTESAFLGKKKQSNTITSYYNINTTKSATVLYNDKTL